MTSLGFMAAGVTCLVLACNGKDSVATVALSVLGVVTCLLALFFAHSEGVEAERRRIDEYQRSRRFQK